MLPKYRGKQIYYQQLKKKHVKKQKQKKSIKILRKFRIKGKFLSLLKNINDKPIDNVMLMTKYST